jgi:hypothetical protein
MKWEKNKLHSSFKFGLEIAPVQAKEGKEFVFISFL